MNYRVLFTSKSRLEFYNAALWWAEHRDAEQAGLWMEQFQTAIDSLKEHPERHAVIHENDLCQWKHVYRRILFGLGKRPTHRAVYRVADDTVYIVAIRHVSQADMTPDDIE